MRDISIVRDISRVTAIGLIAISTMLLPAGTANADVFNMGGTRDAATGTWTGTASLETVHVGDAGNAADTRYSAPGYPYYGTGDGYGSVSYGYNIGKFEVTAGQYCDFLNAVAKTDAYGLYDSNMGGNSFGCKITRHGTSGNYTYDFSSRPSGTETDWSNRPVNYIGWNDAARFANWLSNGQPRTGVQDASTTESGSYALIGNSNISTVTRIADADRVQGKKYYFITSEDEWYKAAYYKGGGIDAGYWDYPTCSDTLPGRDKDDASGNNANHQPNGTSLLDSHGRTNVGEFQNSVSAYGTFDQGGNISEYTEAFGLSVTGGTSNDRGIRGGAFSWPVGMGAWYRDAAGTTTGQQAVGFRVSEVPEPASMALLTLGGLAMLKRRRR